MNRSPMRSSPAGILVFLSALCVLLSVPMTAHALDFFADVVNGTDVGAINCPTSACSSIDSSGEPFNNACKRISQAVTASTCFGGGPHRILINEGVYGPVTSGDTSFNVLRNLLFKGIGNVVFDNMAGFTNSFSTLEGVTLRGSLAIVITQGVNEVVRACRFEDGARIDARSEVLIENSVFQNNPIAITTDAAGGPLLINNTFFQNGTAVRFTGGGGGSIRNSVFANNTVDLEVVSPAGASVSVDFSGFPPTGAILTGAGTTKVNLGSNNLNANPQFVDASLGIFHLLPISPLVSAGTDVGGQKRNIGAFGAGLALTPTNTGGWLVNLATDSNASGAFETYTSVGAGSCATVVGTTEIRLATGCNVARFLSPVYNLAFLLGNSNKKHIVRSISYAVNSDFTPPSGSRITVDADGPGADSSRFTNSGAVDLNAGFEITSITSSREIRFRSSDTAFVQTDGEADPLKFSSTTFSGHKFKTQTNFVQYEIVLRNNAK